VAERHVPSAKSGEEAAGRIVSKSDQAAKRLKNVAHG
jgi:hypothetical protein